MAALQNRRELLVRTPEGFAKRQRVEGFRRYFASSDERDADEVAERGDLQLYAVWAVALGELESWRYAMEDAVLEPDEPEWSDPAVVAKFAAATAYALAPASGIGVIGTSGANDSAGEVGVGSGGRGGSW
ncbi:MAG: hypothetical protein ACRDUA_13640 [Micromonosporaceae bacterium]